MKKILSRKTTKLLLVLLAFVVINMGARGIFYAQQYAWDHAVASAEAMVGSLATNIGYELKQPRLADRTILELCRDAAIKEQISPLLYCSMIKVESNYKDWTFSAAGAIGPAQVMPANAKFCGLSSPSKLLDPVTNIYCGAQLFKEQLLTYNYDVVLALYGYNASPEGVRNVLKCGTNTACMGRYEETFRYSKKVLKVLAQAYPRQ